MCGRNAVQIRPATVSGDFLDAIAKRLNGTPNVQRTPYFLRYSPADDSKIRMTLFPDGRALIEGTTDLARARSIYARYVGL